MSSFICEVIGCDRAYDGVVEVGAAPRTERRRLCREHLDGWNRAQVAPSNNERRAKAQPKESPVSEKKKRQLPRRPKRLCSVDGCNETHAARGGCQRHYALVRGVVQDGSREWPRNSAEWTDVARVEEARSEERKSASRKGTAKPSAEAQPEPTTSPAVAEPAAPLDDVVARLEQTIGQLLKQRDQARAQLAEVEAAMETLRESRSRDMADRVRVEEIEADAAAARMDRKLFGQALEAMVGEVEGIASVLQDALSLHDTGRYTSSRILVQGMMRRAEDLARSLHAVEHDACGPFVMGVRDAA